MSISFRNSSIRSAALLQLVHNTAPFIFEDGASNSAIHRYLNVLIAAKNHETGIDENLSRYYELCIAAHFATVGTFVPTDVDQAIRLKLWKAVHHEQSFEQLYALVKEFKTWDESLVSKRFVQKEEYKLSGHQGEWFSIAVGAYATAHKHAMSRVQEIREAIEAEVENQQTSLEFFQKQFTEDRSVESLKNYLAGIAAVAHNLGDLDRMIDMWELSENDVLRRRVYRLGHEDARRPIEIFSKTGEFYQKNLASENHRHLALREAKPLRKGSQYLLPFGPFFDSWGAMLAKEYLAGRFNEGEFREIVEALIHGWKKLNQQSIYHSQGYARALAGIQNALPRGRTDLENLLPIRLLKEVTEGGVRTHLSVSQKQFEQSWVKKVAQFLNLS